MYRINRLQRNVLITPDEVLFHAATDQKIDERQILQNIIVAEERFIANTICDKFYEDFINKKNKIVTSDNKDDIINTINIALITDGLNPIADLAIGTLVNSIDFVEDEWYKKLWYRFLWKLTAECVDMMAIVPSWLRHTSTGQQQNNPKTIGGNNSNSATGSQKDVQFKIDTYIGDRIDPLIERMQLWICQNKKNFPLYCKDCGNDCGCNGESNGGSDGVAHIRKTNFITNIYND